MIQRLQTVFMFIAIGCLIASLFLPFWETPPTSETSEQVALNAFYIQTFSIDESTQQKELVIEQSSFWIAVGLVLSALVMLISVFQYTNRLRQIQLNALFSLLCAGTVVIIIYYTNEAKLLLSTPQEGVYLIGFFLPFISLLNNLIANRLIRKDERLVQSADRIR